MRTHLSLLFVALGFLTAGTVHAEAYPGLQNSSAPYRVVNPDAKASANPYVVKLADGGEPLPDRMVNVSSTKPMAFAEAMKLVLMDTGITVVFSGDGAQALAERTMTSVKFSGQLAAVIGSAAQAGGASYIYRDGIVRFLSTRPYVLNYPDPSDTQYLSDLIRRSGGVVVVATAGRNEILFNADDAVKQRVVEQLRDLHALKREPSRLAAARVVVAPADAPAVTSAPSPVPVAGSAGSQIVRPEVKVTNGKATITWKGEGTDLVRQMALATGAVFSGIEGKPRPLMVDIRMVDKPLRAALEIIGNAFGEHADLVVKNGKAYSLRFK